MFSGMIRKVDLISSCEVRAFWMIDLRMRRGNIYVISVTRAIRVPMLCIGPVSYISHIWTLSTDILIPWILCLTTVPLKECHSDQSRPDTILDVVWT